MTTMWKAHLNAYRLKHPRVDYKTAQKRASKTYQKTKNAGMAKTRQKSFWGQGKETIDSVQSFRQYLEKHKGRILEMTDMDAFDHHYRKKDDCMHNLPIVFEDHLNPGAVFHPSLDLGQLCQIFYETFQPYSRHTRQKTWSELYQEWTAPGFNPTPHKRKRAEYEDEWHSKHAK